jgi:hypothetical protein
MKPETMASDFKLSEDVESLICRGSELAPRREGQKAKSWQFVRERIVQRDRRQIRVRRQMPALIGLGLGGATAVAFLWLGFRTVNPKFEQAGASSSRNSGGWRALDLGPVGHMTLAPGARLRLPNPEPGPNDPYRVTLDEGQLCAQVNHRDPVRQGPFQIDAKDLRVTDVGTRFCVVAGSGPSWVSVEEGHVQVRGSAPEAVLVGGGESLSADDPRLTNAPPAPAPNAAEPSPAAAPAAESVPAHGSSAKRVQASGELSLENALYEAGLRARETHEGSRALAIWDRYRHRFPHGVFAAEVDLARLRELAAEWRSSQVLTAADEFSHSNPDPWRGGEAELIRADTLRLRLARPSEALPIYERVVRSERQAMLHERALYGLCMSLHALSREAEARERYRLYLERFPTGAHRAELDRLMSPD